MFDGEMDTGGQLEAGEVEVQQPGGEEAVRQEEVNNEEAVVGVASADMELERLPGHEEEKENEEDQVSETETAFVCIGVVLWRSTWSLLLFLFFLWVPIRSYRVHLSTAQYCTT